MPHGYTVTGAGDYLIDTVDVYTPKAIPEKAVDLLEKHGYEEMLRHLK